MGLFRKDNWIKGNTVRAPETTIFEIQIMEITKTVTEG